MQIDALADLLFKWTVGRRTNWFRDATFTEAAAPVIDNARTASLSSKFTHRREPTTTRS